MKNKLLLLLLSSTILLFNSCKKEDEKEETPPVSPPVTTASVMCNPSGTNPLASNSVKAVINGDTFDFPFTFGYLSTYNQVKYFDVKGSRSRYLAQLQVFPQMSVSFNDSLTLGTHNVSLSNTPEIHLTCTLSNVGSIYIAKSGLFELMFKDTSANVVGGKFRALMVDDPNNPTDSIKVCAEFLKTLTKI